MTEGFQVWGHSLAFRQLWKLGNFQCPVDLNVTFKCKHWTTNTCLVLRTVPCAVYSVRFPLSSVMNELGHFIYILVVMTSLILKSLCFLPYPGYPTPFIWIMPQGNHFWMEMPLFSFLFSVFLELCKPPWWSLKEMVIQCILSLHEDWFLNIKLSKSKLCSVSAIHTYIHTYISCVQKFNDWSMAWNQLQPIFDD